MATIQQQTYNVLRYRGASAAKGRISDRARAAGEQYGQAWRRVRRKVQIPFSLAIPPGGGRRAGPPLAQVWALGEATERARQRLGHLRARLARHPDLVAVCDAVCGEEKTPREAAAVERDAARAVQQGISVQGPGLVAPGPVAERDAPWADNPPPATDGAILKVMAPLGLNDFDPGRFSPAEVAAIEAGVVQARADAQRSGLRGPGFIKGWTYPSARPGVFAQEYGYRASVAIGGLAALPPEEARPCAPEATCRARCLTGAPSGDCICRLTSRCR